MDAAAGFTTLRRPRNASGRKSSLRTNRPARRSVSDAAGCLSKFFCRSRKTASGIGNHHCRRHYQRPSRCPVHHRSGLGPDRSRCCHGTRHGRRRTASRPVFHPPHYESPPPGQRHLFSPDTGSCLPERLFRNGKRRRQFSRHIPIQLSAAEMGGPGRGCRLWRRHVPQLHFCRRLYRICYGSIASHCLSSGREKQGRTAQFVPPQHAYPGRV